MAAEDRGPLMHAHVGMMLALHGAKPIPEARPSKTHWGRRKREVDPPGVTGETAVNTGRNHFIQRRSDPETNNPHPLAINRRGPTMLITILNSIYREFLKASLSGSRAVGA